MSLISAGSISLDSTGTFKALQVLLFVNVNYILRDKLTAIAIKRKEQILAVKHYFKNTS